jgi:hypothetical protein
MSKTAADTYAFSGLIFLGLVHTRIAFATKP